MFLKRETEVIQRMDDHLNQFDNCVRTAGGIVHAALDGEIDSAEKLFSDLYRIIEEAGVVQRQIREVLYRGAFLPSIREDICTLLTKVEYIVQSLADLSSLFMPPCIEIPECMKATYAELTTDVLRYIETVGEGVLDYIKGHDFVKSMRDNSQNMQRVSPAFRESMNALIREISVCSLDPWSKVRLGSIVNVLKVLSGRAIVLNSVLQRISMKMIT